MLAVAAAVYLPGWWFLLGREDDPVERADAVVVLAGAPERLPIAISLVRSGVAPTLVVSIDDSGFDPRREAFCDWKTAWGVEVVCKQAEPFSTRGEARMVAELAEREGWRRVVLVTSRYHLRRAERLFGRCTGVELAVRGAPEPVVGLGRAIPFEWAKLALAGTFRRSC